MTELLQYNSENTIELCYFYYDVSLANDQLLQIDAMADEVYGVMTTIQLNYVT